MSTALPSPEQLEALRQEHVKYTKARLRSEAAKGEWRKSLEGGYQSLLAAPIGALVDGAALHRLVDALVERRVLQEVVHPILVALAGPVLEEIRKDDAKLGDYVPETARAALGELVQKRGSLPPHLVRRVLEHDAVEEVMRDVLGEALLTFNERVNPFFADWGLPGLLKRFMPLGLGGGMGKALEALRTEFDKRLEPEVRRFLPTFSRHALGKAADFVIAHQEDAAFVQLRGAVLAWAYEQPVRDLVGAEKADVVRGLEAARDIAVSTLTSSHVRERLRAQVDAWLAAEAKTTVGELLARLGVTPAPPLDEIAEVTWPVLSAALASPEVEAWFLSLVTDFYDSLGTTEANP